VLSQAAASALRQFGKDYVNAAFLPFGRLPLHQNGALVLTAHETRAVVGFR
jgi:hypothetical protein